MQYKITIKETLARTVPIEAEDEEEALLRAEELYYNSDIILDSEDYKGVIFIKELEG